ncbi:MAG: metallophosphoesterase family protein [Pseudomonadota bacterium]
MVWLADARAPDDLRIYAIGDIHGCLSDLEAIHNQIEQDLLRRPPKDWRVVHVGDYVDRGPDSKATLQYLMGLCQHDPHVVCLLGNHDKMFADGLSGAGDRLHTWLMHGGEETLASYGLSRDDFERRLLHDRDFDDAVPRAHIDFLRSLPTSAALGDYFFVHAGIDPNRSLDDQDPETLIWIRGPFLDDEREHPKIIVHGHTPVRQVDVLPNRIGIDTGAVFGRSLTCLVLDGDRKSILDGDEVRPLI